MFDFDSPNIYQILDLINVSIYWKDKEGRYLGCNKYALEKIFRVSNLNEVIGKTDKELLPNGETSNFVEIDKLVLEKDSYHGEEHGIIHGEKRSFLTTKVKFLDNKNNIVIFGTSLDITDMKKQQELDKRNEEVKLKQIIDLINVSIYWKDRDGRYLGCNQYVLDNIFHVNTQEEIVGKTDYELLPQDVISKFMKVDKFALENGRYEGEEYGTVNGEVKTYFASKSRLFDSQGNIIGIVGISMDITDRKNTERLKTEMEKNKIVEKEHRRYNDFINQLTEQMASFERLINTFKLEDLNNKIGNTNPQQKNLNYNIKLSKREREILYCLSMNKSPKEIAAILYAKDNKSIAPATIQAVINKRLYVKFNVGTVSQLVQKAKSLDLVPFTLEN